MRTGILSRIPFIGGLRSPGLSVRGVRGPIIPDPGRDAPHSDAGRLVTGFVADVQSVGGQVMNVMDMPFNATVKVAGPHRIVDNVLNAGGDIVRDAVTKVTR